MHWRIPVGADHRPPDKREVSSTSKIGHQRNQTQGAASKGQTSNRPTEDDKGKTIYLGIGELQVPSSLIFVNLQSLVIIDKLAQHQLTKHYFIVGYVVQIYMGPHLFKLW